MSRSVRPSTHGRPPWFGVTSSCSRAGLMSPSWPATTSCWHPAGRPRTSSARSSPWLPRSSSAPRADCVGCGWNGRRPPVSCCAIQRTSTSRLISPEAERGLAALYLCAEYERAGDRDLLELATSQVMAATRPVPGLGVAATRVSLAQVALGLSPQSIMDHLLRLAQREPAGGAELDRLASATELLAL